MNRKSGLASVYPVGGVVCWCPPVQGVFAGSSLWRWSHPSAAQGGPNGRKRLWCRSSCCAREVKIFEMQFGSIVWGGGGGGVCGLRKPAADFSTVTPGKAASVPDQRGRCGC